MKNVLVFEKERIICLDIKTIFSGCGFNVVFGNSVHELAGRALEPALVILDQMSYPLLEKEKWYRYFGYSDVRQVPMILCISGQENDLTHDIDSTMNVIGKVTKPYDSNELVDIYRDYQVKMMRSDSRQVSKEPV